MTNGGPAEITSGTNLTFTGAGEVSILALQAGSSNYLAAAAVTQQFAVTKALATIALSNLSHTYDGTPKAVTALSVPSVSSVDLKYNGTTNAPINAGSYTVIATVEDARYQGGVTGILTIAKADQAITMDPISLQYTTNILDLSAIAQSGGEVVFSIDYGPAELVWFTNVQFSGAGMVGIAATQAGDGNWNSTGITNSFSVAKSTATLTLTNLSQTYDGTSKSAAAVAVPAVSSVDLHYDGLTNVPVNAGSYTVTATVVDTMYQGATTGQLTIAKASQTITDFTPPASVVWTSSVLLTATGGASGEAVTFAATAPGQIANRTLTFTTTGLVQVTASQTGSSNYLGATPVMQTIEALSAEPVIGITAFSNLMTTTADCHIQIVDARGAAPTTIGVLWATNTDFHFTTLQTQSGSFPSGSYPFTMTNLPGGHTIYARGVGVSVGGTTVTETVQMFLTRPAAPVMTDATEVQPLQFVANWQAAASATGYWMEASWDSTFTAPNFVAGYSNRWVGAATSQTVTNLLRAGTNVYVRARAVNATGQSDWSDSYAVLLGGEYTNVGTGLTITMIASRTNYQEGLVYADFRFCNDEASHLLLAGPYHFSAPSNALYYLARPDGTAADGNPYVDVSTQFSQALYGELMQPGDCVTVTNIPFYFRYMMPQQVDGTLWANRRSTWDAPVALNFTLSTHMNRSTNGQMSAANDCRLPLTYALATLPTQGTVNADSTGAFTYTPTTNVTGRDSFRYIVYNVDGTGTGTVSIVIRGEDTTLPWLMLLLD